MFARAGNPAEENPMKKTLTLAALLMAGAAEAAVTVFTGSFGPEAIGATGSGALTLVHDSTAHSLQIDATFGGLSGTTTVSHIHCCTAVPNAGTAGVALATAGTLPGWPVGVTSGSYSQLIDLTLTENFNAAFLAASGGTADASEVRLISNLQSGNAYFNIHSTTFPGGEIRAFVTVVPEPGAMALMLAGVSLVARRRQTA
jgi:hypothetical protein